MIVAYLAHLGLEKKAIAAQLNICLAEVSRALHRARKEGYLGKPAPPIRLRREDVDRICPKMTVKPLARKLEQRLRRHGVFSVRVIPHADGRPDETFRRVAIAGSDLLVQDLSEHSGHEHVVGFTWGLMLREVIDAVDMPRLDAREFVLVPVSGELSILPSDDRYDRAVRCSSNRLVEDLAKRLGLKSSQYWRFRGPATIPREFLPRPRDLAAVWEMIERDPTVHAILGPRRSGIPRQGVYMIDRIQTLFTGIGAFLDQSASAEFGILEFVEESIEELRGLGIVGEINAHLLVDDRYGAGGATRAEHLNKLAVGASPDDMRRVADRARASYYSNGLGVVVAATGREKARPVLAACRARAVNRLVIASDTADEMLEITRR
jgi:DNA-binding transcriptional regulator LsrR (DeoR family)